MRLGPIVVQPAVVVDPPYIDRAEMVDVVRLFAPKSYAVEMRALPRHPEK
jgi:hypothetical protein